MAYHISAGLYNYASSYARVSSIVVRSGLLVNVEDSWAVGQSLIRVEDDLSPGT